MIGLERLKEKIEEVFDDYGDEIRASLTRIEKSKWNYSVWPPEFVEIL